MFASDEGRYKKHLNVNDHDEDILKNAEKSVFLDELKNTNIKFTQDEMGCPNLNRIEAEQDLKKSNLKK